MDCVKSILAAGLGLVDVMMPNLDGLTLAKAIKAYKDTKSIPLIFLTAKGDTMSMIEGINVGAKYYVTKPFQMDDLLSKVEKVLDSKGHRMWGGRLCWSSSGRARGSQQTADHFNSADSWIAEFFIEAFKGTLGLRCSSSVSGQSSTVR